SLRLLALLLLSESSFFKGLLCNHQLFIGRNNQNREMAVVALNLAVALTAMLLIVLLVYLKTQKPEMGDSLGTNIPGVFTNAAGEHQCIQLLQRNHHGGDIFGESETK